MREKILTFIEKNSRIDRLRNEIQIKVVPRNFRPLHACYVYVKGVFDLRQASAGINTTIHQT